MDSYYIENRIYKCKKSIEDNKHCIKELKNKIENFEYTMEKLKETQKKLHDYRDFKKEKFVSMKKSLVDMKFANSCADSMINFINGSEAAGAHEGIDESMQITNKKIENKHEEIYELQRENVCLENEILDLERELEKRGDFSGKY